MSDLVFMMGQFEAKFPRDRNYAMNHMWASPKKGGSFRVGFTAYAVRLLQDVYFLEWTVDEGAWVEHRQEIGTIESKKAESDLYSPAAGRLTVFNERLLNDPSAINIDKYDTGWLFDLESVDPELMTAEQYLDHLNDVWAVTQRTIKGQLN